MQYIFLQKLFVLKRKDFFLLLLFTFFSILIRGYEYGLGNQIHYLTYVNYKLNPSLYPFDYLLKTHAIPYTIFIDVVHYLPAIGGSQEISIFLLYFFLLYSFYLALFTITNTLFHNKKTSWLTLFFFIYPIPIGGSTITTVEKSLIPRFVAEVFFVFSLYFLFIKRSIISAIFAAIGFLFHPLTMLPYPIIIFLLSIYRYFSYKKALITISVFILILSPMLHSFFTSDTHVPPFFDSQWRSILMERLPYLFIHTWAIYDFIPILSIPFFFLFYKKLLHNKETIHPVVKAILISGFSLFVISLISDIISFRLGIQLQLPRDMYFPIVFSLIFFVHLLVIRLKKIPLIITLFYILIVFSALTIPSRLSDGLLWNRPLTDYEKTAVWAKSNTAETSIFLVPPDTSGFRFWSMRSVVNENKEGGDSLYDRSFGINWDKREDLLLKDKELTSSQVNELRNKFHMNYIVTTSNLLYPLVYTSGNWKIYKI